MNKDYTKIKLRDFRKNLTQLKDSLDSGQIYEVIDRGVSLAYFVPSRYKMKLETKRDKKHEDFIKALYALRGAAKVPKEIKEGMSYDELYRKNLLKKHPI